MKNNTDPFHNTTHTDRLADIIGFIIFSLFFIIAVLVIISLITIFGVQTASAIWGDYTVTYWLADLF